MLDHSSVVVSTEGKEKRKEKKEKKKEKEERKKRSSEALQLDCVVAEGQPRTGRGRDCLLRSIAAFLDSNGFFKTLSVLQSEAQLEVGCWKSSVANLDDLFGKFLDSSGNSIAVSILDNLNNALPGDHPVLLFAANSDLQTNMEEKALAKSLTILVFCAEVGDSLLQDQDDKLLNHPSAKADAKKRKRTSHVDGTEIEIDKTLNNGEKLVIDGVQGKHMEEKAEVSKLDGLSADNSKLSADQLADSQKKVKKKKNKIIPEIHDEVVDSGKDEEMVKAVEELVTSKDKSNITQKSEKKKDKKLKQVEQEASGNASCKKSKDTEFVDSEGNTAFESQVLDGNVAQHKVKKKKQKLNQASEEKPSDQVKQCEIKQDVGAYDWGHQGISVSQDTKSAKKTSKKRKALDSVENVDNENTSKKSEAKSEGAQNNVEIVNLVKSDKYTMDSDNLVITKKRKVEESKGTTKNAVEQLELTTNSRVNGSTSNTKNVAGNQLENASIGKKQKHTEEPKSVNPFQRVKVDHVKFADDRLKDNSYWAKDGADIGYGAKAQEVLGQVRGRDFRHEKTKKKRGSYRGGEIDLQSHSIKFTYSDEE